MKRILIILSAALTAFACIQAPAPCGPPVRSQRLRVRILSSKASPVLCGVGLYFEER